MIKYPKISVKYGWNTKKNIENLVKYPKISVDGYWIYHGYIGILTSGTREIQYPAPSSRAMDEKYPTPPWLALWWELINHCFLRLSVLHRI